MSTYYKQRANGAQTEFHQFDEGWAVIRQEPSIPDPNNLKNNGTIVPTELTAVVDTEGIADLLLAALRKANEAPAATDPMAPQLYDFTDKFSEKEWEEIDSLPDRPYEEDGGAPLYRKQWMGIAYMCLGKAQLLKDGRWDTPDRGDKAWAEELIAIADLILAEFKPADGKY
jgi:hypothetical protein